MEGATFVEESYFGELGGELFRNVWPNPMAIQHRVAHVDHPQWLSPVLTHDIDPLQPSEGGIRRMSHTTIYPPSRPSPWRVTNPNGDAAPEHPYGRSLIAEPAARPRCGPPPALRRWDP